MIVIATGLPDYNRLIEVELYGLRKQKAISTASGQVGALHTDPLAILSVYSITHVSPLLMSFSRLPGPILSTAA